MPVVKGGKYKKPRRKKKMNFFWQSLNSLKRLCSGGVGSQMTFHWLGKFISEVLEAGDRLILEYRIKFNHREIVEWRVF